MVFFTSILIVFILYYLQAEGLIYVTIIALVAELINIFMAHTMTKSVEKRLRTQHRRILDGYTKRIKANKKTIIELEQARENSVKILYNANMTIKELEEKLTLLPTPVKENETTPPKEQKILPPEKPKKPKAFIDLPDGSNRNRSQI